jgi:spermine/spermidine synthase
VAFVLVGWQGWRRPRFRASCVLRLGGISLAVLALVEVVTLLRKDTLANDPVLEQSRSFYGVLTVTEEHPALPVVPFRTLYNGGTLHGRQYIDPIAYRHASTYYSSGSALGQMLEYYQQDSTRTDKPLNIGAIGLGVGTIATYVFLPWHTIRFYEINPDVVRLADKYFTYLADARKQGAKVEIVLGDARLSLERELDQPREFDVLVLDAFSSDSIPTHLLTKEAFDVYQKFLVPDGAIAVHISNNYLDLAPVVYGLAEHFQLSLRHMFAIDVKHGGFTADWIILSHNVKMLDSLREPEKSATRDVPKPPFPLWTDQRHNLLEVLK